MLFSSYKIIITLKYNNNNHNISGKELFLLVLFSIGKNIGHD